MSIEIYQQNDILTCRIGNVLPSSRILLCSFHVLQAWQRWLKSNMGKQAPPILSYLQGLLTHEVDELYTKKLEELRALEADKDKNTSQLT